MKKPKLILQPDGSSLCGQCCVAMAAGVGLSSVRVLLPEHLGGTTTRALVGALRSLGVNCADRLKNISKSKHTWPKRAILSVMRPEEPEMGRKRKDHWLLAWDGEILDPGGRWPEGYDKWKITSYLEIYE